MIVIVCVCVRQGVNHHGTTTMTKVFPSFLELITYAGLVTSGPGRILPFIGGSSSRVDRRPNLKETLFLSLLASSTLLLSVNLIGRHRAGTIDTARSYTSPFTEGFSFHPIVDERIIVQPLFFAFVGATKNVKHNVAIKIENKSHNNRIIICGILSFPYKYTENLYTLVYHFLRV